MNNSLSPTYQKLIGRFWVLWYSASNSYSIVDTDFKYLIDTYLNSDSPLEFNTVLQNEDPDANGNLIAARIQDYLESCNVDVLLDNVNQIPFNSAFQNLSYTYKIGHKVIVVNYDSELVQKTVHPAIAHYITSEQEPIDSTFDIYLDNDQLFLFKDQTLLTSAPKLEYHKIQGKFIMHLLCEIHQKTESDWIGTFHGSTITDGHSAILCIGESGKGKSTLCALLTAKGFTLLADDVSPMDGVTHHIHYNPAAISIKEGAFKILERDIPNFEALPLVNFNKAKGTLKYLPCTPPEQSHYPCFAALLVNYKANAETSLERVSVKRMLETLIPDSWLSPNPAYAKAFLNWLAQIEIYEITYSNIDLAAHAISKLFKSQLK
ncbi:hypothetical protein HNV08_14925 [Winogradskyella eckloniae]|uniref:hypothetical protein n=1 Tax=Winogradskyella eckloniae TaxID=1089306 RepID=UPI00156321C0|nr:hypothetical protein [Winogradskyella eckloniae]NRD21349.1 hypothetical protein [Winogradskyella eckloniae]